MRMFSGLKSVLWPFSAQVHDVHGKPMFQYYLVVTQLCHWSWRTTCNLWRHNIHGNLDGDWAIPRCWQNLAPQAPTGLKTHQGHPRPCKAEHQQQAAWNYLSIIYESFNPWNSINSWCFFNGAYSNRARSSKQMPLRALHQQVKQSNLLTLQSRHSITKIALSAFQHLYTFITFQPDWLLR